jgi:hypothetical protein
MKHLEELAELYALGSLEAAEESSVRAHIADCEACRQRVSDAERVVLAFAETEPQVEVRQASLRARAPSSMWRFAAGLAAGLVLPLLILLPVAFHARQSQEQTDVALSALVNSHFNHVAFTRQAADAPAAKLLYARNGQWLYVIVVQPRSDLGVLVRGPNGLRAAGTIPGNRAESALFIAQPGAVSEVLLTRGGSTVAQARPVIASR